VGSNEEPGSGNGNR